MLKISYTKLPIAIFALLLTTACTTTQATTTKTAQVNHTSLSAHQKKEQDMVKFARRYIGTKYVWEVRHQRDLIVLDISNMSINILVLKFQELQPLTQNYMRREFP